MDVEFLPDAKAVGHRFTELLARADSVDIVVAWAGNPRTGVQRLLWKARHKVRRRRIFSSVSASCRRVGVAAAFPLEARRILLSKRCERS